MLPELAVTAVLSTVPVVHREAERLLFQPESVPLRTLYALHLATRVAAPGRRVAKVPGCRGAGPTGSFRLLLPSVYRVPPQSVNPPLEPIA